MKISALIALTTIVLAGGSAIAEEASPDIFQISKECLIPAGSNFAQITLATSPGNKRMVIQTAAYLRSQAQVGSTGLFYLFTNTFGVRSSYPLPTSTSLDFFNSGGATLSATIYNGAGGAVTIQCIRNGDLIYDEDDFVTITGYYVAKP